MPLNTTESMKPENQDKDNDKVETPEPQQVDPRNENIDPHDHTPDPTVDQSVKLNTVLDEYRNMVREWMAANHIHVPSEVWEEYQKLHNEFLARGYRPEMTRNVKTRDDDPKMESDEDLDKRFDTHFDKVNQPQNK